MSTARVDFTRGAAERIAAVVRRVEQGDRDGTPLTFGKVDPEPGKQVRYVQWSGTWQAGGTQTITFVGRTATAQAVNAFAGVDSGTGWVARHSATWHLMTVALTSQPNFSSGEIQMLGHDDSGILRWYSITTCGTATSSP